jgi:hypothetical protein
VVSREDNEVVIVGVGCSVVWTAAKCISFVLVTRFVLKFVIILLEFDLPRHCT